MALVTVSADASIDVSTAQFAPQISGELYAGEALAACAAVYIDSAGAVRNGNGTANDASAKVHGFVPRAVASGEPCTIFGIGTRMKYSDGGLTAGAEYFLGATDGRLDTAATTGGTEVIAIAVDTNDIVVVGYQF